ncbi:hypothetical protein [Roseimaritima ulvae]|uniref:Uncharacterized protein n=1 Tax=Roseimaritima ulvae TaxID=980254 RepID=A0A5B9QWR1_9BACT|nr:hypothetical protein [Roseimaritima ulvae]QEG43488.1 hypothetical protein UC8_55380 [Roseimaritima ulvae]
MARRVVSRKDKIAQAESVEAEKTAKKKKKAKTAKRKTKAKPATEVRMKMYWGVFSQSLKRIAVFEYDQKSEAEKRAAELSKGGKSPHFVQKVKEEVGIE